MRRKYRRRSVFPLALAALLLLSGAAGGLYYHQMGPRKQALFERAAYYRELAAGEAAWLSSIQLENGAIPFRGEAPAVLLRQWRPGRLLPRLAPIPAAPSANLALFVAPPA